LGLKKYKNKNMAAEGTSNPYSCDEATKLERLQFQEGVVASQPDAGMIAMYVSKSNNDNFVIYKWHNSTRELKPHWIIINRRDEPFIRKDLNAFDMTLYGLSTSPDWEITLNVPQLAMRVLSLSLNDSDEPTLMGTIDGKKCTIEKAFVEMRDGLLPDVKQITIFGRTADEHRADRFEIIKN
jgi:hypothetical protein